MKRMVVLGDSIAFGQFVHPHKTWVHLLSEVAPMPIDNFSWTGDTTRLGLERSIPFVQRDGCEVAYIQYGCNDANQWDTDLGLPRVSIGAFVQNLEEMVTRCRAAGATTVLIGTNHPTTVDTGWYDIRAEGLAKGLACIPVIHGITTTLDGVHPDEQGHREYFERIRGCLGW